MNDLKVALVTGGSRGIGRAIAVELSKTGYYVVVNYKSNEPAAKHTLELINSVGGDGEIVRFDVANAGETEQIVNELIARLGHIRALINNAGITADGLFMMMQEGDWDAVINTTLKGFFNVTKPVIRNMVKKKAGVIVSISSVSAMMVNRGQANYAAAKAGLIAASRSLAAEVGRLGIRVNVVAPGLIDTEMTQSIPKDRIKEIIPMNRIGRPEEVARVVNFLCSEDASYITGQTLCINGGMC